MKFLIITNQCEALQPSINPSNIYWGLLGTRDCSGTGATEMNATDWIIALMEHSIGDGGGNIIINKYTSIIWHQAMLTVMKKNNTGWRIKRGHFAKHGTKPWLYVILTTISEVDNSTSTEKTTEKYKITYLSKSQTKPKPIWRQSPCS